MTKQELQKLLVEHSLTQRQLAIKIGVAEASVSDWLSGKRDISPGYYAIINKYFDTLKNKS
jgi:plasmid maintenance system antidote protein VapI